VFAVSGVVLLLSTIWMFVADHNRAWKPYQRTADQIELQMMDWRELQFEGEEQVARHAELAADLAVAQAAPVDETHLTAFRDQVAGDSPAASGDFASLFDRATRLRELAANEPQDETERARNLAQRQNLREQIVGEMRATVREARFREDTLLGERKFKSADRDQAVAEIGLMVRDGKSQSEQGEQQAKIDQLTAELRQLTLDYESAREHREALERILDQVTTDVDQAEAALAANTSDLQKLENAQAEQRSTYFTWWGMVPIPGKKWLELPILDAFNSPRKIDNLWSAGLEIDYNFRKVRRFDRCTTCHHLIDRTLVGTADQPAYVHEHLVDLVLLAPEGEAVAAVQAEVDANGQPLTPQQQLQKIYGLRFAEAGLLDPTDITVQYVRPESLAAQASVKIPDEQHGSMSGAQIREMLAAGTGAFARSSDQPGLAVGDVLFMVNGDPVTGADRTFFRLLDAAEAGEAVTITVRRGLPNPFTSHPRLDLFVGSLSPHTLAEFACTICHDGQGSATAFEWASHSPDSERQRREWVREHGWFDNPHWIYPMLPARFSESSCLKCHHEVAELAPSERFPDPPAPHLMHGYDLVRKYGCYACHEINGYDGDRRIGPDMRLEPNVFAAAQGLQVEPGFASLDPFAQDWVRQLVQHPDRDEVRARVYELLLADQRSDDPQFSNYTHEHLTPLFAPVEHPGRERKVGPSLRFVASKLDPQFMYEWIREPKAFRPSTRMPQIFGLWDHIHGTESEAIAQRYESIEILGIVTYLRGQSQPFDYIEPVEGAEAPSAERGHVLFQTRGCLACHTHQAFQDADAFRAEDEIVQGPDLSRLADKFRHPDGGKWLYTWIKQPTSYHARTVMPDLFLSPVKDQAGTTTDPAADIVEFLLSDASSQGWTLRGDAEESAADLAKDVDGDGHTGEENMDALLGEFLRDAFAAAQAKEFAEKGIPESLRDELKGAEVELVVSDEQRSAPDFQLPHEMKLNYIGRKAIAKHGCFACHDIPGFEDAKPIGTSLADWGRKDTSRLAFEHIVHYIDEHGRHKQVSAPSTAPADVLSVEDAATHDGSTHDGSAHDGGDDGDGDDDADVDQADNHGAEGHDGVRSDMYAFHRRPAGSIDDADPETFAYYDHQLRAGHRAGFIYQKLLEPRSFDYHKTENKKYNERLRMPEFPFNSAEREAVITFVLGLVADPPNAQYIFQPDARAEALVKGRQVVEKFNCGGCHIFGVKQWDVAYREGTFPPQPTTQTFPFLATHIPREVLQRSQDTDVAGRMRARVDGMPLVSDADGLPVAYDDFGDPIEDDDEYDPTSLEFPFELWQPAVLEGNVYEVGVLPLSLLATTVEDRARTDGGFLAKYLMPHVVARAKQANPAAKGTEAWGWLPPPLIGQGQKVQADWLHDFLLDPYPIRPATVLRMPRFNMSAADATALVNYFAARDNADYPYAFSERRRDWHVADAEQAYQAQVGEARSRFGDAMKIVTDKNYCIKCHLVGDFVPAGEDIAKAPNLADVYRRLRPDYLRNWIANPKSVLPYTSMPVNIPYDPNSPSLGGVSQDLYHGTSIEQLDALVDLLMNFDTYANRQTQITSLVTGAPPQAAGAESAPAAAASPTPMPEPASAPTTPAPTVPQPAPATTSELPEFLKNLPQASGWGDVTVQFVFDGPAPAPERVSVTNDVEFCGKFDLTDESLVVNPANGGIANVVAYLYVARGDGPMPIHEDYLATAREAIELDNLKCRFEPRVATIWTPQKLVVGNDDVVGHNTKIDTFTNPAANQTVPAGGQFELSFSQAERLPTQVSCSIHPWMKSWLVIKDNPYSAVSDADGKLTIKNLPVGKWTIQFWHEQAGYVTDVVQDGTKVEWNRGRVEVSVEAGKVANLGLVKLAPAVFESN